MAKQKSGLARVLLDYDSLGVRCGQLLDAPERQIAALLAAGVVDSHPDAVAAAVAENAQVIMLTDPEAAAELAAALA